MGIPNSPLELFDEAGYNSDDDLTKDDAAWVLQCAFLVLTMQTGFAMLEGGCVSRRNMANIMIKNVCDVSIGGMAYWLFGYGLTFGPYGNAVVSYGDFAFSATNTTTMGTRYSRYFFQFSFASTATTIVSGAIAERMKLKAYMIFSFANIVIYAIPACWCWNDRGFLKKLGFYDFSGVCVVHLNGGASALASAWILGPRLGRFTKTNSENFEMSSPPTALTGMFILTWACLAFTCGSTFGVTQNKWKISALVASCTLNSAIGGGLCGLLLSMIYYRGQIRIDCIICSILGGLVCISGLADIITTWESLIIGGIGAAVAIHVSYLTAFARIDDPVGAIPVHFGAAVWGTLAVGLFGRDNIYPHLIDTVGLFHGGGFHQLGVNALGAVLITLWSGGLTLLFLLILDKTMGIRMSAEDEVAGADLVDHNIKPSPMDRLDRALDRLSDEQVDHIIGKFLKLGCTVSAIQSQKPSVVSTISTHRNSISGGFHLYSTDADESIPRISVRSHHLEALGDEHDGLRKQSNLIKGIQKTVAAMNGIANHFGAKVAVTPKDSVQEMITSAPDG